MQNIVFFKLHITSLHEILDALTKKWCFSPVPEKNHEILEFHMVQGLAYKMHRGFFTNHGQKFINKLEIVLKFYTILKK